MDNKVGLTWIIFYMEFASVLLKYKNNRNVLIDKLKRIYRENEQYIKFPTFEKDKDIIDIDPFSVFGLFNKGIKDSNRKLILEGISKEFGLKSNIPLGFDGIPILNNLKSSFFGFMEKRGEGDIDRLWNIFEAGINYADNKNDKTRNDFIIAYNNVIKQYGVNWNITMGLFWIRPNAYVNLDATNRDFIIKNNLIDSRINYLTRRLEKIPKGQDYLYLIENISINLRSGKYPFTNFVELSSSAWNYYNNNKNNIDKEINSTQNIEEYNPNITKEQWEKFIINIEKPSNSTSIKMLKGIMELGGEASCNVLIEKYGGNLDYYVRSTLGLGKRAKKYFNLGNYIEHGKERIYVIPFVGKKTNENNADNFVYSIRKELREALNEIDLSDISPFYENENLLNGTTKEEKNMQVTDIRKNTILYGPPGTGKTYNTVLYAVAIIENKKLADIKSEKYEEVLKRYNQYKSDGLIEFTTFHQSYGYEEFIEGIKPIIDNNEDENSDVNYKIEPGVFKAFCDKAETASLSNSNYNLELNNSPEIWKVSLEGTGENRTRSECMENGHIRIGYDFYGENIEDETKFEFGGKNVLNAFISKMKVGDIVLSCYSSTTIDAIGIVSGEYEWHDEYEKYKRLRKVKWIVKGIKENIVDINNGCSLTLSSVYRLNISLSDVINIISKYSGVLLHSKKRKSNFVFIIDEINRGNISSIFGELITLIEESKRIGAKEELKLRLPYSKKLFGVLDNIYILGTMNTADRSIALIDTALRRRFDFVEVLPNEEILNDVYVEGVSIKDMLKKINMRIAALYDREHMIGHSYFIPLINNPNLDTLSMIFKKNIIPLLQEYFYEDYEKIGLILGDNNKNHEDKFIVKKDCDYNMLFGSNVDIDIDIPYIYEINEDAFENINAYKMI
ncbi:AAA family ATPase [Anaerofustis butyriciformans]|uniref:AAA family ATPase n=1 Tax=Anaerofustis butyriciformans TaxID=3108533 RepID=UPI003F8BBC68